VIRQLRRIIILVLAFSIGVGEPSNTARLTPSIAAAQTTPSNKLAESRRTVIVDAVQRLGPSVVSISVTSRQRVTQRSMFDLFFVPRRSERLVQGYGTGFVIRPDGVIITNHHVVADAETIVVTLPQGEEYQAELVGVDPVSDIAVLRIDEQELPTAPLGRSTDLLVGEWVVALGNPYGYLLGNTEPTVTAGVISGTGRNLLPSSGNEGLYLDMIQTDAAINPGNSGGPLVNANGEVVGVNSSIFTSSGGSIGLGFAIPIERAVRVAEEILANGTVRRPWTGLEVAGADAMRDWKRQGGVLVTAVAPGGPAAKAGIRGQTVLIEAKGRTLRNYLDWEAVKLGLHVGDSVTITYRDSDDIRTRVLVTDDLPTVTAERVKVLEALELVTVTPGIQAERGLQSATGGLIIAISDEASESTGLHTGDVILRIGGVDIKSAPQVSDLFASFQPGQRFRLVLERDGNFLYSDLIFQ
jgi:serine protease Do